MTKDRHENPGNVDSESPDDELVGRLVCEYMDRLVDGDAVDVDDILRQHPRLGPQIVRDLEVFSSLSVDQDEVDCAALGTLGDYTLRRQIGRGGMGVVYEAWQNSVQRSVALKVLPGAVAADDKAFHRFMREARTAAKLSHPNIVGVHGMGQEENTPYYAMEMVEGETLSQILAKEREAPPEEKTAFGFPRDDVAYYSTIARCFADVADGLQHAHSKGVIHRDVKPSNLILDSDGRLRILDFGLARLEGQESLTLSGDLVGTPLYMSPEQARRRKIPIDHRTDIYSLGVTMYEMLTGRPPFRGKDHQDTLSQIVERDPVEPSKINSRVPNDLETIVLKCLRKNPEDRYGTAEALAQDLGRFVRGDPIEARPQARWEKAVRRLSRNRRQIVTRMLLLALLLAVGLLAYELYKPPDELARNANPLSGYFEDAVPVDAVNSPYSDMNPICSFDNLELYFGSRRPEGRKGDYDIWVVRRSNPKEPWGAPENVEGLNSAHEEIPSWLSLDGLRLYYETKAPKGMKDIRFATRKENNPAARWEPGPREEYILFNTRYHDESPCLTSDECEIFFSSDRPGGVQRKDLYHAERASRESSWNKPRILKEISTLQSENQPCISPDGLTLWWGKRNTGEICYALRETRKSRFGPPMLMDAPVNSYVWENGFKVSPNWPSPGAVAYFFRSYGKGAAACDIYRVTWHPTPGRLSDPVGDAKASKGRAESE